MSVEFSKGWWLVAWTAMTVCTFAALVLAVHGPNQQAMHLILRATARTSLVLFLAAFLAAPLRAVWPSRATRWLIENRRYVGVSFATSHTVHFAAIIGLTRVTPERPDLVVLLLGGVGYAFILAMAATSLDTTAAWLGPRRWKMLHTCGVYYIWSVFALTSLGGVMRDPLSVVSVALLASALLLRLMPSRAPRVVA
jgi:methionine sulfoxide reductase heme-binding subunit